MHSGISWSLAVAFTLGHEDVCEESEDVAEVEILRCGSDNWIIGCQHGEVFFT
jgi:hypothetical protein